MASSTATRGDQYRQSTRDRGEPALAAPWLPAENDWPSPALKEIEQGESTTDCGRPYLPRSTAARWGGYVLDRCPIAIVFCDDLGVAVTA